MTFTLEIDYKLLKCEDYSVDNNVLTLRMKTSPLKFEKRLYEDVLNSKNDILSEKIIINYCNTYKVDGKTFKNCFPIYANRNEIQFYFSDSVDVEKIKELIHD